MKINIILLYTVTSIVMVSACNTTSEKVSSAPEKVLSAVEVKALFTNKTFDGYNEINGVSFQIYSAADGTMIHRNPRRTKEATWEVDSEGRHCANLKKKLCGHIASVGNGVYHKTKNGEHTRTLKNFTEGNRL